MEQMGIVQARTPENIKESANNILNKLGLNMSAYINMALNQLVIQEKIPFSITLNKTEYMDEEKIEEVKASLKLEGLDLEKDDILLLHDLKSGKISSKVAREAILNKV